MPPFLLIQGTADRLAPFEQSELMFTKMREAGAACELFPVKGGGHGLRWWYHNKALSGYQQVMTGWLGRAFDGRLRPETKPVHAGE